MEPKPCLLRTRYSARPRQQYPRSTVQSGLQVRRFRPQLVPGPAERRAAGDCFAKLAAAALFHIVCMGPKLQENHPGAKVLL